MRIIDPEKCLPLKYTIKDAGSHLYTSGLTFYSFDNQIRHVLFHPLLVFISNFIFIIHLIHTLKLPNDDESSHIIFGDFTHFLNAHHAITAAIFALIVALLSQIIHFWNLMHSIRPVYLRLFEILSGSIPPQCLGLENENDILNIIKAAKFFIRIEPVVMRGVVVLGITGHIPLALKSSLLQLTLFVIPWIVYLIYILFICFQQIYWQVIYLCVICYYLRIKLTNCNESIKSQINEFQSTQRTFKTICDLNFIYEEISEYNSNYWDKFLLCFCAMITMSSSYFLYLSISSQSNIMSKIIIMSATSTGPVFLISLLSIVSSVTYEADKSYKLFHRLMARSNRFQIAVIVRLKVINYTISNNS